MNNSAKTFLTAVLAVAGAALTALLLAEQGVPPQLHTAQLAPLSAPASAPQDGAPRDS